MNRFAGGGATAWFRDGSSSGGGGGSGRGARARSSIRRRCATRTSNAVFASRYGTGWGRFNKLVINDLIDRTGVLAGRLWQKSVQPITTS